MSDRDKIVQAFEKALVEEDKVGLVLQQLQTRTGLSREKTKIALAGLINEKLISESSLTSDDSDSSRKLYFLKETLDAAKKVFESRGVRSYA